jgi:putative Mg2+ transporter-C (MgtC) family protein
VTPAIWTELELILRLLAGVATGVAVGWERNNRGKSAGIRTFGLVGLGTAIAACIFTGPGQVDAASRVIQGVLTGIGFLGAGVITLSRTRNAPRGLTTAAAIWATAALGCAAGRGDWPIVLTGTAIVLLLLVIDGVVERWVGRGEAAEPDEPVASGPAAADAARTRETG